MPFPARQPWWKKKRWAAAGLLWLLIAYPLSLWPVAYMVGRGWVPATAANAYLPVLTAADFLRPHPGIGLGPPHEDGTRPYIVLPDPDPSPKAAAENYLAAVEWFAGLGKKHAASN